MSWNLLSSPPYAFYGLCLCLDSNWSHSIGIHSASGSYASNEFRPYTRQTFELNVHNGSKKGTHWLEFAKLVSEMPIWFEAWPVMGCGERVTWTEPGDFRPSGSTPLPVSTGRWKNKALKEIWSFDRFCPCALLSSKPVPRLIVSSAWQVQCPEAACQICQQDPKVGENRVGFIRSPSNMV